MLRTNIISSISPYMTEDKHVCAQIAEQLKWKFKFKAKLAKLIYKNKMEVTFTRGQGRTGLAIRDTGGIPGGPTGLGWSKIPAHFHHQPALPLTSPALQTIFTFHFLLHSLNTYNI